MILRGAWVLFDDANLVGRETWRLEPAGDGWRYEAAIERTAPFAHAQALRLDLSALHLPAALEIRAEGAGRVEQVTGAFGPARWTFRISRDGRAESRAFPATRDWHLDYFSPIFNTATILRLDLEPGQPTDIDVVYLEPVGDRTFAPSHVRQRYERLPDGSVSVLAGTFAVQRYRYTALDTGHTAEIAVDEFGTVLQYPGVFELAEYEVVADRA